MDVRKLATAAVLTILISIQPHNAFARVTKKQLFYILHRDGITSSLEPFTKIHSLGRIFIGNQWYSLFFYDHVTRQTQHGSYRILILNDREEYIGGFNVDDGVNCRVLRRTVRCDDAHNIPYTLLDFTEKYVAERVTTGRADENFWK